MGGYYRVTGFPDGGAELQFHQKAETGGAAMLYKFNEQKLQKRIKINNV